MHSFTQSASAGRRRHRRIGRWTGGGCGVCGVAAAKSVVQLKGGLADKRCADVAANRAVLCVPMARLVVEVEVSWGRGGGAVEGYRGRQDGPRPLQASIEEVRPRHAIHLATKLLGPASPRQIGTWSTRDQTGHPTSLGAAPTTAQSLGDGVGCPRGGGGGFLLGWDDLWRGAEVGW